MLVGRRSSATPVSPRISLGTGTDNPYRANPNVPTFVTRATLKINFKVFRDIHIQAPAKLFPSSQPSGTAGSYARNRTVIVGDEVITRMATAGQDSKNDPFYEFEGGQPADGLPALLSILAVAE